MYPAFFTADILSIKPVNIENKIKLEIDFEMAKIYLQDEIDLMKS